MFVQADVLKAFSGPSDGVYAVDMRQRIVYVNDSAERSLGYRADELLGKRCYRVLGGHAEDESRLCGRGCSNIQLARQGRAAPWCTMSVRTAKGDSRWWSVTNVLLPGAGKRLSILVHIFHDVTEDVEARRLARVLSEALSRATRALTRPRESAYKSSTGNTSSLSSRELEVLRLMARGLATKAIAEGLSLSSNTVRSHVQRILTVLGVHTRLEAVAAAIRRRVLPPQPGQDTGT